MKLASFRAADRDRIGVVLEGGDLIDLSDALRVSGMPEGSVPRTMLELIESESVTLAMVRDVVARVAGRLATVAGPGAAASPAVGANPGAAASLAAVTRFSPNDVIWLPPVRRPSKIC